MTFAYFNLKTKITKSSIVLILLFFCSKCEGRKSLPTGQIFCRKTVYFTKQNVFLKQPIRIECLIKQKPGGALAGKQECMRRGR